VGTGIFDGIQAMWTELSATETESANKAARFLVLAVFLGLGLLVGTVARGRRHRQARLITVLGLAFFVGLLAYVTTVRPVERWTIWAIAGAGYGALLVWAFGGGSGAKRE
jgi:hypothetical protein